MRLTVRKIQIFYLNVIVIPSLKFYLAAAGNILNVCRGRSHVPERKTSSSLYISSKKPGADNDVYGGKRN
jgi:hypothetical protein